MTTISYPVRVDATLDEPLSRWLWLVKWLLAIPHFVVLAFLWAAFVVLSVAAFVAILVTGRYPASVFAFNVGVLRWTWRVFFYAYGTLGTDRYPPFTLADVPDYPAHLEISYPEHLSRGLVLVKTWLLAIPHYIVVTLFIGGAWFAWQVGDRTYTWNSGGLVGILVLVAAALLTFSGSYPRPLFDFILGMNRWALRVAAYAALMTDDYPPFRLDMGGSEQGDAAVGASPAAGSNDTLTAPAPPPERAPQMHHGWTAGRVTGAVVGALAVLLALGTIGAGATGTWADRVQRDSEGYVPLGSQTFAGAGYAVVSEPVRVHGLSTGWGALASFTGQVRVRVTQQDGTGATFVGLAPTVLANEYLAGVARTTVHTLGPGPVVTTERSGGPLPALPTSESFWTASASGAGSQTIRWTPTDGDWTLATFNADGTRGVAVTVALAAELPALGAVSAVLLVVGIALLAAGVSALAIATTRAGRPAGA